MRKAQLAIREPLGSGQRILLQSLRLSSAVRNWIMQEEKVKWYRYGRNLFRDADQWPQYIYVNRQYDESPLDDDAVAYLDELVRRVNRKFEEDEEFEDDIEFEEYEEDEEDEEDEGPLKVAAEPASQFTELVESLTEAVTEKVTRVLDGYAAERDGVNDNLKEIRNQAKTYYNTLDESLTQLHSQLMTEIKQVQDLVRPAESGINISDEAIDSLLKAVEERNEGSKEAAEQIFRDAQVLANNAKADVASLQSRCEKLEADNQSLKTRLQEQDVKHQKEKLDLSEEMISAMPESPTEWSNAQLDLLEVLSEARYTQSFVRHIQTRIPGQVNCENLSVAILQLIKGTTEINSIKRKGYRSFAEYRCNLGDGKGTGRLYFDTESKKIVLLGFGNDKDKQRSDIDRIFENRKTGT